MLAQFWAHRECALVFFSNLVLWCLALMSGCIAMNAKILLNLADQLFPVATGSIVVKTLC